MGALVSKLGAGAPKAEVKNVDEQYQLGKQLASTGQERESFGAEASQGLIKQLQGQTTGEGPSLADAQLRAATDRNLAQQLAAAQAMGAQGGNPAAMQRQLMQQQAATGQQLAQQSGIQQLQEQQAAQQLLANTAGQQQILGQQLALGGVGANRALTLGEAQIQNANAQRQASLGQALLGGAASAVSGGLGSMGQGGSFLGGLGGQ